MATIWISRLDHMELAAGHHLWMVLVFGVLALSGSVYSSESEDGDLDATSFPKIAAILGSRITARPTITFPDKTHMIFSLELLEQ